MKPAALLLLLPALAFAHPDHGTEPGKDIDTAVRTGNGAWQYEAVPHWGELPDGKNVGPTHGGVVIDPKTGNIYVSTDAPHGILVYQPDGKALPAIAPECQGFHAMAVREEEGQTVIYGAQLAGPKALRVCKIDTTGKQLLEISQATAGDLQGGWGGLTAVAVAPDGSIFCSMGYGAQFIHKFDAAGKHLKTFGGSGKGDGQTDRSHGLAIDTRFGEPRLLVCDRENRRLVHFDLEGNWIGVHATHLRRPCSVSILGDHLAVAELEARVTILDKSGTPVAFLGDNPNRDQWAKFPIPLDQMHLGIFTSPHGLSFDKDGNLYVQDWNQSGRVTKLQKL
ncbi:6-bladed beta-propeller [Luteolibacter marinus]|uniref:6-bladed beta-propeller n=1 Tax=Luteolibacter marinus TaxID=2776705 RepID=UPI00186801B7|nr:6-bladed beta-propeller [Luteolibacter marinus]